MSKSMHMHTTGIYDASYLTYILHGYTHFTLYKVQYSTSVTSGDLFHKSLVTVQYAPQNKSTLSLHSPEVFWSRHASFLDWHDRSSILSKRPQTARALIPYTRNSPVLQRRSQQVTVITPLRPSAGQVIMTVSTTLEDTQLPQKAKKERTTAKRKVLTETKGN